MRIVITGSPGTGKTAIAKALAKKLSVELIDIKRIVLQKKLREKNHEVDLKKLSRSLAFLKNKKSFIAEGHLACEIRLPADFIFVLRAKPKALNKRLSKRGYGRKKLDENILSELLDYCTQRAQTVYHKRPLELDTTHRSVSSCALVIEKAIKRKKKKLDAVDYSGELKRYLRLAGQ